MVIVKPAPQYFLFALPSKRPWETPNRVTTPSSTKAAPRPRPPQRTRHVNLRTTRLWRKRASAHSPTPRREEKDYDPCACAHPILSGASLCRRTVRALDSKICEQDEATALAAIETTLKLVANIIAQPSELKFRRVRANNPSVQKKLLRCPGGQVRRRLYIQ